MESPVALYPEPGGPTVEVAGTFVAGPIKAYAPKRTLRRRIRDRITRRGSWF